MPQNFTSNPGDLIEKVFSQIHKNEMADLQFVNPNLSVKTVGFELYDGDWLGVLLTPWTLSLLLLAGPGREWQSLRVGDRLGLKLPSGSYTFLPANMRNWGLTFPALYAHLLVIFRHKKRGSSWQGIFAG